MKILKFNVIKKYKEQHSHEWVDILGKGNYDIQEDNSQWNESLDVFVGSFDEEED